MANIDQGVRQHPVAPEPEALAHARNREDAPVLQKVRQEVNLLGGDATDVDADYTALLTDRYVFVDTSAGAVTVTLPAATNGKHITVRRSGGSAVTVEDESGTLDTLSADGDSFTYYGHNGSWLLVST